MSGKELHLVGNNQKWCHIPIAVGGSAPKKFDLIEFEELKNYDLKIVQSGNKIKTKEGKNELNSKKKKQAQRQQKRTKLKAKIFNEVPLNQSNKNDSKLSRKRKAKCLREKSKKIKLKIECNESKCDSAEIKSERVCLQINQLEEDEINLKMSDWNNLNVPLPVLKSLCELGFTTPMPIQKQVLSAAIAEKRDVLGSAETGSGKTLAFGIPLIHHLLQDKEKNNQTILNESGKCEDDNFDDADLNVLLSSDAGRNPPALILTPTRELAIQVTKHLKNAAKYTGLLVVPVVGGMSPHKQVRLLKKDPDIVVATPGRLWDMISGKETSSLSHLDLLRYLVIDEADRMLEPGHFEDLTKLLSLINVKDNPVRRQTFVFSATLTVTHSIPSRHKFISKGRETKEMKLSKLMRRVGVRSKPHIVDLTTEKVLAATLDEGKMICDMNEKDLYLYYFLKTFPGKTLVFTNSIDCIFRLSSLFELLQCSPLQLHAKMQQRQRLKHLDRFQQRNDVVMFASDVAARGLDIPDVDHVIHYQSPRTVETYVHRSGRCARSGRKGYSLLLLSPRELQFYKRLCGNLNREEGLPDFSFDATYMDAIRKRVLVAREVDALLHRRKKIHLNNNWFAKAARAAEMELDDDLLIDDVPSEEDAKVRAKKELLGALLRVPVFPKGFSGKYVTKEGGLLQPGFEKKSNPRSKRRKKR